MDLRLGSWPQHDDEIALGRRAAQRSGPAIGDTVRVQVPASQDGPESVRDLRVTGLVDESASLFSDLQSLGVVTSSSALLDSGALDYLVVARPGVDPDALATTLVQRLPADTQVITSAALAREQLAGLTDGVDTIRYLLLGFGSIAALVGSMIITNALGIVVAQRRRQIALLRVVGATRRQIRDARPSARLAGANLVRNPARSAAVCSALMLGVGLIVTLQVGAASVQSSTEASVRHEFPVAAIVRASTGALPAGTLEAVRALPGIQQTISVPSTEATVGDSSVRLDGLGAGAGSVVAAGLDDLDSVAALAHPFTLETLGKSAGDHVTVRVGGRSADLLLRASDVADAGALVITTQTLQKLDPTAPVTAVWAATRHGANAAEVMDGLRTVAATEPGLEVSGSLQEIAAVGVVLAALLQIAIALTAVAVVIALVGMGNSLSLSVIERSRELALLRALGLQRGQLRGMLAVEAILLALIGAGVGVLAGAAFGMVGAAAMAGETGFAETRFAVSGWQTVTVVAAAVAAGAVASVLPGRRAARSQPAAALAET